ncbi:MAG: cupin domain-containing protein [Chloroflexota bacterium]|jgi:quercetin dioxygenase-like cupin family protein
MTDAEAATTAIRHEWAQIEPDHPADKASRQLISGERMMVARFVLEEGFEMEPHVHHNEQISVVVEGRLLFRVGTIGSDEFHEELVSAGQVMELPPFVPHAARALERTVVFDLFSPPSERTGIDQG